MRACVSATRIKESKLQRYLARQSVAPRLASQWLESERGIAKLRTSISMKHALSCRK